MKFRNLFYVGTIFGLINTANAQNQADYPITPVNFTKVTINDNFWKPRLEKNIEVSIPSGFRKCEETGRIDNFKVAGKLKSGEFRGMFPFDDSDVYKIIEGASYSLLIKPDPALAAYLDSLISFIAAAQEPDGYLMTWVTINPEKPPTTWSGDGRWTNIQSGHELYNMGHFYEAAVAHYTATGKKNMLDLAIKNADLIVNTFGPDKMITVTGHEELEIGLVKLYRVTGNRKYLDIAKFFIDHRGNPERRAHLYGEYAQDHIPVIQQDEAVGHAVRAGYLYSAMTDVCAITGDSAYLAALNKIWENVVSKKIYITGGVGAKPEGEAYGANYELPNKTAYNETCAAIASVYWNHRMFLLTGDSKYIDVLERTLYNGALSGISLSGNEYFYPNPLESDGTSKFNMGSCTRSEWFACSCCPSNVTRFMPSLPGYVYATRAKQLYINLFVQNSANLTVNGNPVSVIQTTEYPWKGDIKIQINPQKDSNFDLLLRIPGWATGKVMESDLYQFTDQTNSDVILKLNGKKIPLTYDKGYAVISRNWKKGDYVELSLPMEIKHVSANSLVEDDRAKLAIERGPIVYCAEEIDNSSDLFSVKLSGNGKLQEQFNKDLLGGVMQLTTSDFEIPGTSTSKLQQITLVPYYSWNNRGAGKMRVWFPAE